MMASKWYKRISSIKYTEVTWYTSAVGETKVHLSIKDPETEKRFKLEMDPDEAKDLGESLIQLANICKNE